MRVDEEHQRGVGGKRRENAWTRNVFGCGQRCASNGGGRDPFVKEGRTRQQGQSWDADRDGHVDVEDGIVSTECLTDAESGVLSVVESNRSGFGCGDCRAHERCL